MIDKWFKKDLQNIYDVHPVAVFIDESGDAEFLLKTVEGDISIHIVDTEVDELHVKYLIEKAQPSSVKFLIYTQTKRDKLKFIREYCETNGCLEIRFLQNYVKEKVHQTLQLNINLPEEELLAAAKVSVGKDKTYWMDLSHKGTTEIFDLNKELLPFVHDPEAFASEKYDDQLREIFYKKVNELLGHNYINKPVKTLATEVVQSMLNGLAINNINKTLDSVYIVWTDSLSYRDSLFKYIESYSFPPDIDIWTVSINHPFRQIDEMWLSEIGTNIVDKTYITNIVPKLKQRAKNKQAKAMGIKFWNDIIVLLEFDPKDMTYLSSFSECVEFYKNHFYILDTAIRNLYSEFLNKRELLEPYQELYKNHISIFLDKWFHFFDQYKEEQTGILQRIIDSTDKKIAIIVGDGVAFEIAEQVALKVKDQYKLIKNSILADVPSETENNMSRIYLPNGTIEKVHNKREKSLTATNPNKNIEYIKLDEVSNDTRTSKYLICTYKDIDDMGEKLQQKSLKYFPETISFFSEKIELLLSNGYSKVYMITDHGFVLTGLLTNADKISVELTGDFLKSERYIRTEIVQDSSHNDLVHIKRKYGHYNHLYFSKNLNPFKTPGLYGFSHGGLSPQELITPYFCWERNKDLTESLNIIIDNKESLNSCTGELYQIIIKSDKGSEGLLSARRKVYLSFSFNNDLVNKSDIIEIHSDTTITKEYSFDGHNKMNVQLLDASTKELLDSAVIKKNDDRDLGGLF